jgi:antitoxin FitA
MGKTVQIRDLDDDVYAALRTRAAEEGISVPELLRREATRLASKQSMRAWLLSLPSTPSGISSAEIQEALDELRGPWPDSA